MQVRVANRQDEPAIRAIVNEAMAEHGKPAIDLVGADRDLNNIEYSYFWHDGIFLVAEEEGKIIGLVGARRGNSEDTLAVRRLAVSNAHRGKGAARSLVDAVIFFAGNLDYRQVELQPARHHLAIEKPIRPFTICADPELWSFAPPQRCLR